MKTFESFDEIRDTYFSQKYDIFYEDGDTKYDVTHIGSTVLCIDSTLNRGMGAVWNFDVKKFYAIEKPIEITNDDETKQEILQTEEA